MDKKKWLWKRKSSERSPGDTESSGSFSSHSERYSDEQDALRESQSPSDSTQSPEITSRPSMTDEAIKSLTEKLSAALVNVSAKEDLVKQHAKVAEEAVAGWEKAENEVAAIKQQLEAAVQQNLNLEVRVSHLDGALKECVRQLRQARDEHEKDISDAITEKQREWDSTKAELEKQILELQAQAETAKATEDENPAPMDPKSLIILETLEKENSILKQELASRYKELETMTIERDLSTHAAETASKLQLESIKKVAKLEAEIRKLQAFAKKSSPVNTTKPIHFYAESLTDSQSDSGERLNGSEPSCSDSWASALILELEQFKNEKPVKTLTGPTFEIDIMDDFLEMERLAALHETKSNTPRTESASVETSSMDNNPLRAELDLMTEKVTNLEKQLEKLEAEKIELENALDEREFSLKAAESSVAEVESKLNELEKKLDDVNKEKELLELQLVGMEVETRTLSANVDLLKAEIEKERKLSGDLRVKCQELENGRIRSVQETEIQQNTNLNGEVKLKQEDLAVAADKLAECQKTIASLGRQLKSLATLEDFLVDTSTIPGFSRAGPLVPANGAALSKNDLFTDSDPSRTSRDKNGHLENGNNTESPPRLSSSSSSNHVIATKSRNGFGKFFSRSKSVVELEN